MVQSIAESPLPCPVIMNFRVDTPGRKFWVATLSDGTVVGATALRTERPEPSTEPASSSKGSDGKEEGKDKKKASTNSFRPLEEGQGELLRMTVSSK
jgi:hypothetical protein